MLESPIIVSNLIPDRKKLFMFNNSAFKSINVFTLPLKI